MLERSAWAALIPHQGRMALIEHVLDCSADALRARSDNHRDPHHPLRRGGRLHAVHLCEYGAQAMAVHGALVARDAGRRARPGLLVALRAVELHIERIDDLPGALIVEVRREHADAGAWLYRFDVQSARRPLAGGMAIVKLDPETPT